MEIIFNEEYLQTMYETGKTDKQHRFQPQIIRKYVRVIDLMRVEMGKPLQRYVI